MRNRISILLALTVFLGGTLLGGCDFQRVDEGADMPLARVMEDLANADTPEKAETAIEHLFQKAEIGISYKSGMFDGYKFADEDIKTLAKAHAAYITELKTNPGAVDGRTVNSVFDEVKGAQDQIRQLELSFSDEYEFDATVDEALNVLSVSARYALRDPERPESALLLGITTPTGDGSPQANELSDQDLLSPIQRLCFGVWLHKRGPALRKKKQKKFSQGGGGNPNTTCEDLGMQLVSKFEWSGSDDNGSYVFEKPGDEPIVVLSDADTDGGSWTSPIPISAVIIKAGTNTVVDTDGLPAMSGDFSYNTPPAISHIEFCRDDEPDDSCVESCYATHLACLVAADGDQQEIAQCNAALTTCVDGCHDQGGGSN
jgi:hypothetical protein